MIKFQWSTVSQSYCWLHHVTTCPWNKQLNWKRNLSWWLEDLTSLPDLKNEQPYQVQKISESQYYQFYR